jgi:hypothetical protein
LPPRRGFRLQDAPSRVSKPSMQRAGKSSSTWLIMPRGYGWNFAFPARWLPRWQFRAAVFYVSLSVTLCGTRDLWGVAARHDRAVRQYTWWQRHAGLSSVGETSGLIRASSGAEEPVVNRRSVSGHRRRCRNGGPHATALFDACRGEPLLGALFRRGKGRTRQD